MLDGQSHSELVDQVTTLIGEGRLMNAVELLEAGIAERSYHQRLRACWCSAATKHYVGRS